MLSSEDDVEWLNEVFIPKVQQRGAEILKARGLSSAMSAASAACDHMRDWIQGTKDGECVSMGVYSDGSYGQPADVIYSFPCVCEDGKWRIVQGLELSQYSIDKLKITADELLEEKALAYECVEQGAQ